MISTSVLRTHLFSAVELMIEGQTIEVWKDDKVYNLKMELTDKRVNRRRPKRKLMNIPVIEQRCPKCHDIMINSVCMNLKCDKELVNA